MKLHVYRLSLHPFSIGLSTGGLRGTRPPFPEFDMGGGEIWYNVPSRISGNATKKYYVNISDAAIILPLEQHQI